MLPIFLNLTNRLVVVVGGGPVGRRKARTALDAQARVRLVCLEPLHPDLDGTGIEWLTEAYRPDHLDGAAVAFAAAGRGVSAAVIADARARGVWVNAADEPGEGDFYLPAVVRRGEFTLAVGTGGAAPALAKRVKEKLEADFDDAFSAWVAVLAEMRLEVLESISDAGARRVMFEGWTDWAWLERVRRDGPDSVREALRAEVRARRKPQ